MEWLKKINPFVYILISVVLICIWGVYSDEFTQEKIIVLLVQIVLMGLGYYGTYLKGELSLQDVSKFRQKIFKQHARDRYRRLHGLLWELVSVREEIEGLQKANMTPSEINIIVGGIPKQLDILLRYIARDMETWRGFAPNELDELHRELVVKKRSDENAN